MSAKQTKEDLMRSVAAANLNSIPVADSITPRGFLETASNWLGRWWHMRQKWQAVSPGYCALVFDPNFSAQTEAKDYELVKLFRDAYSKNLGGAVYVMDYSLNKVYRKKGVFDDANAIVRELEAGGLATAATVLFEPEAGILLLAQDGVSEPLVTTQLGVFDGQLTVTNVDKLLEGLYNSTLKYPETFPHVWFEKAKFIPIFEAEKLYQGLAFIHLRAMTQNTWLVVREDQNNAGRTDLSLSTLNPQTTFVLEIKVLRSFHYDASGKPKPRPYKPEENEAWANSGIDQVLGYRLAQSAAAAFLLLYDMRDTNADIASVATRCAKEDVEHRRYYIHNATARDTRAVAAKS
ncbi:hypothetical protein Ga0100231_021225 [Opitutaceae bacterium TAV4]|nr:hypothetical protein Ga0100231_021225 [Opitutaceae bacterium TAV4]RRJ99738.1 hypothetical protein Ga0100230_016845 [Opitutaceae bacterium TAV3]